MNSATRMRDAPEGVSNVLPADRDSPAPGEGLTKIAGGAVGRGAARGLYSRILLVLLSVLAVLSVLLFWPVLQLFYWPAANGVDVIGYPIGRDFINIWAGPRLAFGDQLWALF